MNELKNPNEIITAGDMIKQLQKVDPRKLVFIKDKKDRTYRIKDISEHQYSICISVETEAQAHE